MNNNDPAPNAITYRPSGMEPAETFVIRAGEVYTYKADWPRWATGHKYRVLFFARHMPVNSWVVVLEGVTGPDRGKRYTCSLANFATRYLPLPEDHAPEAHADPEPPEKVIRYESGNEGRQE